jgi:hypothetical protein
MRAQAKNEDKKKLQTKRRMVPKKEVSVASDIAP